MFHDKTLTVRHTFLTNFMMSYLDGKSNRTNEKKIKEEKEKKK